MVAPRWHMPWSALLLRLGLWCGDQGGLPLLGGNGPPVVAEGKLQTGRLKFSSYRGSQYWRYMSKFGYGLGSGTYSLKIRHNSFKTSEDVQLQLTIYLDEEWQEVEAMTDHCGRRKLARQTRNITVPASGNWSREVKGKLNQFVRPHIWYFALSDCNRDTASFNHHVRYEFHAKQDGGSEFSVELRHMLTVNVLGLFGFVVFVWIFVKKTMAFARSAGSVHPVIWVLSTAMITQFVAQVCHTLHLVQYMNDGDGIKVLEVTSEILFMISQVTQVALLILIALGYTLLQSNIGDLDLLVPLSMVVGMVHLLLVGFSKVLSEEFVQYHDHEGLVGWCLMGIRLFLYSCFLLAVHYSAAEGGMAIQRFYSSFRNAGSVYFLAYPSVFLVTKCFAPYLQHGVMTVGLMAMQMGSNIWLSMLFLTRGDYFKVSTLSSSELPGGSKFGLVKEE